MKIAIFLQSWRLLCHTESGRVPALGFGWCRNRCQQLGFYLPRVMKQDYPLYKHTKLCEKHLYWDSRTKECPLNAGSWHSAIAGSHVHTDSLNPVLGSTKIHIPIMGAVRQPEFLEQPEYPAINELCSAQATPLPPGVVVPC